MSGYHKRDWETFPMHKIKRVNRPTTQIYESKIQKVDEREHGFNRAFRGDFGPLIQKERMRFSRKHPFSGALVAMQAKLREVVDGIVAAEKAPIPEDPVLLACHIKETAYFLRADAVGICKLPSYAVYSHSAPNGDPIDLSHKFAIAILVDQDSRMNALP
jgi:hypothetical protein